MDKTDHCSSAMTFPMRRAFVPDQDKCWDGGEHEWQDAGKGWLTARPLKYCGKCGGRILCVAGKDQEEEFFPPRMFAYDTVGVMDCKLKPGHTDRHDASKHNLAGGELTVTWPNLKEGTNAEISQD